MFVGLAVALALVAGLGVGGWLYFTGRLGFGPLSASDKDAAAAIRDDVGVPAWADEDQVECAVDELVHDHRADGLADRGIVEGDGGDWSYTGEWAAEDATAYFTGVLDCSDDWAKQVGELWELDDTACLEDIGTETIGAWFAAEELTVSDPEDAEEDHAKAVEELDDCYVEDPEVPEATAKPAYRSVRFTFADATEPAAGELEVSTGGDGNWTPLRGTTVDVETDEGGERACVEAQARVTYAWGSTAESAKEFCGVAQPKRVFWKKTKCTLEPGCYAFQLRYEGFEDFATITARYTSNGGGCMASSGSCSDTVFASYGGRGSVVTWSFPSSYRGNFVAKVGNLRARIPN